MYTTRHSNLILGHSMQNLQSLHDTLFEAAQTHLDTMRQDNYYNIFEILGIEDKEIRHSKMIADLLNPQGRHGMGMIFLDEFLKAIDSRFISDTLKKTKIQTERVTEYGNIDIAILHPDFYIVIENKIYAGDQKEQLSRYAKSTYNDKNPCKLVYLTLRGHQPSEQSVRDVESEKIVSMSYLKSKNCKKSIIEILENDPLKNFIAQKENLKSVIEQYKNTLTNLVSGYQMKIEVNTDNIEVYQELSKAITSELNNFRQTILQNFLNSLLKALNEKGTLKWEPSNILLDEITLNDKRYSYADCKEYSLGIGVDSTGLYLGYYKREIDYDAAEQAVIMEKYEKFNRGRYEYIMTSIGHNKNITDISKFLSSELDEKDLVEKINVIAKRRPIDKS